MFPPLVFRSLIGFFVAIDSAASIGTIFVQSLGYLLGTRVECVPLAKFILHSTKFHSDCVVAMLCA